MKNKQFLIINGVNTISYAYVFHYFPGAGVSDIFKGGGGPNANLYRNPFTYLLFSRGEWPDPLSPSGSAHGQCHHNGTIFITVRPLTIIIRH